MCPRPRIPTRRARRARQRWAPEGRPGPLAPRSTHRRPRAFAGSSLGGGGRDRGPRHFSHLRLLSATLTSAPAELAPRGAGCAGPLPRDAGRGGAPGGGRGEAQAVRGGPGRNLHYTELGKRERRGRTEPRDNSTLFSRFHDRSDERLVFQAMWSLAESIASSRLAPPTSSLLPAAAAGLLSRKSGFLLLRFEGVISPAPNPDAVSHYAVPSFIHSFGHSCSHSVQTLLQQ